VEQIKIDCEYELDFQSIFRALVLRYDMRVLEMIRCDLSHIAVTLRGKQEPNGRRAVSADISPSSQRASARPLHSRTKKQFSVCSAACGCALNVPSCQPARSPSRFFCCMSHALLQPLPAGGKAASLVLSLVVPFSGRMKITTVPGSLCRASRPRDLRFAKTLERRLRD
jgi:hypothetical protein